MQLPDIEKVADRVHAAWMKTKRSQGVESRLSEDGEELMVSYSKLSHKSQELDRQTVLAVYRAISAMSEDGVEYINEHGNTVLM